MDRAIIVTLFLTIWAAGALAGETCYTHFVMGYSYKSEYCTYGCCGSYPNQECCAPFAWVIIVAVIGSIVVFLSCIICVICCVVKKQGHRGQVMAINPGARVTTIAQSNATTGAFNYGYQQPSTAFPPNQGHFQQPYQQPVPYQQPYQQPVPYPNDSKQGIANAPPLSTQPE